MGKVLPHPVKSCFLDSGAFSLKRHSHGVVDYKAYMDAYAHFIRDHRGVVDLYANVDVIGDPGKTWEHQRYLEDEHGLTPVPVVHFETPLEWLEKYLDRGYDPIALGGLVGSTGRAQEWLNNAFRIVCNTPNRLPCTRLHGFGIVNYELLTAYPWWAVDSSAWVKEAGRWGCIFVPRGKGEGSHNFKKSPYKIITARTATKAPTVTHHQAKHFLQLSGAERRVVREWLEEIGVSLEGVMDGDGERRKANILFFERLRKSLPLRPYPLEISRDKGLGVVNGFANRLRTPRTVRKPSHLKIYYSGTGGGDSPEFTPEAVIGKGACIMPTYYDLPNKRWGRIVRGRRGETREV